MVMVMVMMIVVLLPWSQFVALKLAFSKAAVMNWKASLWVSLECYNISYGDLADYPWSGYPLAL